jgi:hypothetical protein
MTVSLATLELTEEDVRTFARKLEVFAESLTPKEQRALRNVLAEAKIFINIRGEEDDLGWWSG